MKNKNAMIDALAHTKCPAVHITPLPDIECNCTDSKFGGTFYLPAQTQAPVYPKYGEMEFLAQLNFYKIPHIDGFPEKGLLQFFLCTDEEVMEDLLDHEGSLSSDGYFQVIYYPQANDEQCFHKGQAVKNRWSMEKLTGAMAFAQTEEIATLSVGEDGFLTDLGYEGAFDNLSPELMEDAGYDLSDCPDTDAFCLDFGNWGCKIGGHPSIRQGDMRLLEDTYTEYSILLFQYDLTPLSLGELEADTFSFFIKPEDLKACRFDDILLCWHNCY